MENYDDQRRRQSAQDERYRARPGYEDRGSDRESWRGWSQEDQRPRRAERGWLDYDRDYGRNDEGRRGREESQGRDEQRYAGQRPRYSPDWSREGAEPRYSDDPYYSRNRERGADQYSSRGRHADDRDTWEQRARSSIPREQHELAERGERGDYYDPDWPYQRGARGRGRDVERSGDDDSQSHYRGYYRSSAAPFTYPGGTGYVVAESLTLHGPYTGRGPKGYKRSDQQIVEEACQRLERDGDIDASDIEVTAEDGVIRLRGSVPDRRTKRQAEECVESVYGARDVMNELRVSQQHSGDSWQGSQAGSQSGAQAGLHSGAQPGQTGRQGQPGQTQAGQSSSQSTQPAQKH